MLMLILLKRNFWKFSYEFHDVKQKKITHTEKEYSTRLDYLEKNTKFLLNNTNNICNNIPKYKLVSMKPQATQLYSLIKFHKDGHPMRPVVSCVISLAVRFSKNFRYRQKLIP